MKNDLLKLKQEILKQRKYVPLFGSAKGAIIAASKEEGKTLSEYKAHALKDTDELVTKCENIMEQAVILFGKNNIQYDSLVLTTKSGLLCASDFINDLTRNYDKYDNEEKLYVGGAIIGETVVAIDGISNAILDNIGKDVSLACVPMSFSINTAKCRAHDYLGREFFSLYDCIQEGRFDSTVRDKINELCEINIFGVVNFNKFAQKIKSLGYDVSFTLGYQGMNIRNYERNLRDFSFNNGVEISFDFDEAESEMKRKLKR